MAESHGRSWGFYADLPSSPLSGNRPDVSDPGHQPLTFRPPSTTPSESDEVLSDAADDMKDVDEEVRGWVLQEVDLATTRAATEAARLTVQDDDSDYSVMLSSPERLDKSKGAWKCDICSTSYRTPLELHYHCMAKHDCEGRNQLGPRGFGLIVIQNIDFAVDLHETYLISHGLGKQMDPERRTLLEAYVQEHSPKLRSMARGVDLLLAEDINDVADSQFQFQRAKAALDYLAAQKIFLELELELDTLRRGAGPVSSIDPMTRVDGKTGRWNALSDPALIENISGETRFVLPDWDAMTPLEQARAVVSKTDLRRINKVPTYIPGGYIGSSLSDVEVCDKPLPLEKSPAGPVKHSPDIAVEISDDDEMEVEDENEESSSRNNDESQSNDTDWLEQNDSHKAFLVNWGRWNEMDHNVPAYLRHIRIRDSPVILEDYLEKLVRDNGSQAAKDEEQEAWRERLNKFREREARAQSKAQSKARARELRRERRKIFRRAPWQRERGDSRENSRHRRRHRLWRTRTRRSVWLRLLYRTERAYINEEIYDETDEESVSEMST